MCLIVFKHEKSDKASVDSTHTQGVCGGDLMDSPTVSILHSPITDVKYVFVSSNIVTIFKIIVTNDSLIILLIIRR